MILKVISIFDSIDGEANAFHGAGQPSTFIRLAGCNIRCGYCDTEYSWGPGKEMTLDEILARPMLPHVSITGGEPLMQKRAVETLCLELVGRGRTVSIETNGTVIPFGRAQHGPTVVENVRFVADYKLTSSDIPRKLVQEAWPAVFAFLGPQDIVKFVVADQIDLDEALAVRKEYWPPGQAFLPRAVYSPVADIMKPTDLVDWLLKNDPVCQMSLQIHKILWPNCGKEEER